MLEPAARLSERRRNLPVLVFFAGMASLGLVIVLAFECNALDLDWDWDQLRQDLRDLPATLSDGWAGWAAAHAGSGLVQVGTPAFPAPAPHPRPIPSVGIAPSLAVAALHIPFSTP